MSTILAFRHRDRSVLIVDDEPSIASALEHFLGHNGFRVKLVRDGEEALAAAEQWQPDLILLDLKMSGIGGIEVCRRLKAAKATRDIPVIFLTALTGTENRLAGFEAGAVDFVIKPFELREVLARVNAHVSNRAMQQELLAQNASLRAEMSARQRAEEELKRARDELTTILENASVGVLFTRERIVQRCNQRLAEIFNYDSPADMIGKPANVLYRDAEHYDSMGRAAGPLLGAGQSFQADWLFRRADGSDVWCRVYAKAVDPADTTRGTVWILEDISQAKRTEEALHRTLREMEAIMSNAPVGVSFSRNRRLVRYNAKWGQMFGLVGDSGIGLPARIHYRSDEEYDALGRVAAPLLSQGRPFQMELWLRRQDGTDFWANLIGYVLNLKDPSEGTIWICEDRSAYKQAEEHVHHLNAELEQRVTERTRELVRANAELQAEITERKRVEHVAHHDALTGLPNRMLFEHDVTHAIVQARRNRERVALLFLDLDGFKDVNDSLGHDIGDRLLQEVAERLRACLREGDDVARLGGDEFVVVLPALTEANDAMPIAGKVLEAMREPFVFDQQEVYISGSIGISLYPADGKDMDTLLRAADAAMYHAKQKGRDNYQFFTESLNQGAQNRQTIAQHLRRALEHDELVLLYQPQVDLASGTIRAAEALIRWHDSDVGPISPGELISVAEETGLMAPLGEWILRQACQQVRRWRNAGHPDMRVAVNVSPYQFRSPGFAESTARVLREADLPAAAVELELTEDTLMTRSSELIAVLEQLAAMGLQLAEDDFGTGFSSLSSLQRFPVHTLKIDGSIVGAIGREPKGSETVAAIIAMAHSMNLNVVAEGVETDDQATFLRSQHCEAAQGFYFREPMPGETLSALLGN